jgi:molybdenum cofactor synthesis domain-containing protein
MSERTVTAALVIIGNEILSGRTPDANLAFIAKELNEAGVQLKEARVVPDEEAAIVEAVNACRARHAYVFTTGGIGPTHDDITAQCIAKAVGRPYRRHPEAERRLRAYYPPEKLNDARLKMAEMPEGAELIDNPISVAPGFRVENVFVLPGVPSILQAMFAGVKPRLRGGAVVHTRTITLFCPEGDIAAALGKVQAEHPAVEIGSYPFMRQDRFGTSLVFRSGDQAELARAAEALLVVARKRAIEVLELF